MGLFRALSTAFRAVGKWEFEDKLVEKLVRSPKFNHLVQSVHRRVNRLQNGPNPDQPLAQGEATRTPGPTRLSRFLRHFREELHDNMNELRNTKKP